MQNKIYIGLALVLLAALAVLGSREHIHIQERESWTIEKKDLTEKMTKDEAEKTVLQAQLLRAINTQTKSTPVQLPSGQIAYMTEETSSTVEDEITQLQTDYEAKITDLKTQLDTVNAHAKDKTTDITKAAPAWNVLAGWEPVSQAYYLGGGMNAGPVSIFADNPVALEFKPRLNMMLRF